MAQTVQAKALFDCVGDEESELTFNEGDIITDVKGSSEDGWLHGRLLRTGEEGLFPDNYVEVMQVEAPAAPKTNAPPQLPARAANPTPSTETTPSLATLKPQLPARNNRLSSSPPGGRNLMANSVIPPSRFLSPGSNTQSMYGTPTPSTAISQRQPGADSGKALSEPPALPKRGNSFVETSNTQLNEDTPNEPALSVRERMANLSQAGQRQISAHPTPTSNLQQFSLPPRPATKDPTKSVNAGVICSPLSPATRPALPPRDGSSRSLTSNTSTSTDDSAKHVHHIEDASVPVPKLTTFARPRSARTGKSSGSPLQKSSSSMPSVESTPPRLPNRSPNSATITTGAMGDTTKVIDAANSGPVRFSPTTIKQTPVNAGAGLPTVLRNAQPLSLPSRNTSSPTPNSASVVQVTQVTLKPTIPGTNRSGNEQNSLQSEIKTPIASPFGVKLNSVGSMSISRYSVPVDNSSESETTHDKAPPLPARSSTIPITASTPPPEGSTTPSTRMPRNINSRPFSPSVPNSPKSDRDIETEKLKNAGMLSFSPSKGTTGTRVAIPPPKMPEVTSSVPVHVKQDARRRYEALFKSITTGEYIKGAEVYAVYVRSRLDSKTLAQIWEMVDVDSAGRLNRAQFCMGLYLIDERLASGLIPLEVSDELWVSVMQ
ncbi:Increased rDNA silencing protein [Entomortierella beljakovae]|nr:Increased rDNA silencing protein [Entomortierella beljakovae]